MSENKIFPEPEVGTWVLDMYGNTWVRLEGGWSTWHNCHPVMNWSELVEREPVECDAVEMNGQTAPLRAKATAIPMPWHQDTETLQQQARDGDGYSMVELEKRGEKW